MSRRGNSWDNAPMENFFAISKKSIYAMSTILPLNRYAN